jgi:hypothetical protein
MRPSFLAIAATALLTGLTACNWVSLASHAASYRATAAGEAGNVVIYGPYAYSTLAEQGLALTALATGQAVARVPPPAGSQSIDDLAVADGLLFVLDARAPGFLSVLSLADPKAPALVSGPVPVPVGPFTGVSAAAGRVVVSGGTSRLTLRSYDPEGHLGAAAATADLGRGQPDVLLSSDGRRAYVSTHFFGPRFGITVLDVGDPPALTERGRLELETFGFTAGGAKPANFPVEMAARAGLVLVAHSHGLAFVDVRGASPTLVKLLDPGVEAVNVDVVDDMAVVVGSSPRPLLAFVDIARPEQAAVTRSVPLPPGTYATGVAIGPAQVAVAAHGKGVLLYPR